MFKAEHLQDIFSISWTQEKEGYEDSWRDKAIRTKNGESNQIATKSIPLVNVAQNKDPDNRNDRNTQHFQLHMLI